jgi:hypothetical protein
MRVVFRTRSVPGCVTTRSVGTITRPVTSIGDSGSELDCMTGFSREAVDLLYAVDLL